jgi:hypothetical protein
MTHSVTFCRSSRGGMLHTVTYSRGKMVANRCVRDLDFFLLSFSTFSDFATNRDEITWPANRHPPLSCCRADHSQLSQLRSTYFAFCGMRHSFNNLAYLMFLESLCFITNKFSCFMCFWRLFYIFFAGISQARGTSWSAYCDNELLCVPVLWKVTGDSIMGSNWWQFYGQ